MTQSCSIKRFRQWVSKAARTAAGTPTINKPVSFLLWHVKMSAAVKSAALQLSQLLNYSLTVYAQALLYDL